MASESSKEEGQKRLNKWTAAAATIPGGQPAAGIFYLGGKLMLESGLFAPGHAEWFMNRDDHFVHAPKYSTLDDLIAGELASLARADFEVTEVGATPEKIESWIVDRIFSANPVQFAREEARIAARETLYEMIRRTGQIPVFPILQTTLAAVMGDGAIEWLEFIAQDAKKGGEMGRILLSHLQTVAPYVGTLGPISLEYVRNEMDPEALQKFEQWEDEGAGLSHRQDEPEPKPKKKGIGFLAAFALVTVSTAAAAAAGVVAWRLALKKKPIPSSLRHPLT